MKHIFSCFSLISVLLFSGCTNNSGNSTAHQNLMKDHKAMESAHDTLEAKHKELEKSHDALKREHEAFLHRV